MKLSVKDRLKMSEILPKESNIITQSIVRDIIKKVTINQDEQTAYEMKPVPGGWSWNSEKAQDKDIEFTGAELGVLKTSVIALDREAKVTLDLLDVCLKIQDAKSA